MSFVLDISRSIADQIFIQYLIEFIDHFLWPIYWAAFRMSLSMKKKNIESELRWTGSGHKIETAKILCLAFKTFQSLEAEICQQKYLLALGNKAFKSLNDMTWKYIQS